VAFAVRDGVIDVDGLCAAFHRTHEERYGHSSPEEAVEWVTVRVRASGPSARVGARRRAERSEPETQVRAPVWFDASGPVTTHRLTRDEIVPGETFHGPAVVFGADSTVVIPPGASGRSNAPRTPCCRGGAMSKSIDAITLEVLRHAFVAVAEEMNANLIRTAYSPNIKERRDCSSALFDATGELIAQAESIPVHLGAMPYSVAAAIRSAGRFSPGDVVVVNDPYAGGAHLPDVTFVAPSSTAETSLRSLRTARTTPTSAERSRGAWRATRSRSTRRGCAFLRFGCGEPGPSTAIF